MNQKLAELAELTEKLSEIGTVAVIKDDYTFTLLMTNSDLDLSKNNKPFKVMELVSNYITDKEKIEVMKSDSSFILIVLKP